MSNSVRLSATKSPSAVSNRGGPRLVRPSRGGSTSVHLVTTWRGATNQCEARDTDHAPFPLTLPDMALFRRRRRSRDDDAPSPREAQRATREHLAEFVRTRVGVEAYVEPETHVTQTTVVLVATTAE